MPEQPLDPLTNHRRALLYSSLLLLALFLIFIGVGKHPGDSGTTTTWAWIGHFDGHVYDWVQNHRFSAVTAISKGLNFIGSGIVTVPFRIAIALYLAFRRRWRYFAAWVVTWIVAETALTGAKAWFDRMRPPASLVPTTGPSFPSGHAVATASIVVALVLAFMHAGPERRKWEVLAAAAAFVMALSRVYLNAHWFSDTVAGVLLGTAIALGATALISEILHLAGKGSEVEADPVAPV
ncbi:MAG TPA: phosphatase PAP2 family protein [Actinomycetota bacterium]|nr:phosphatase PAP2 family protein [Actinomycetota bacterium]